MAFLLFGGLELGMDSLVRGCTLGITGVNVSGSDVWLFILLLSLSPMSSDILWARLAIALIPFVVLIQVFNISFTSSSYGCTPGYSLTLTCELVAFHCFSIREGHVRLF